MRAWSLRLAGFAAAALLAACTPGDPFHTRFAAVERAVRYEAARIVEPPASADRLTVMTWNVKFGGGRIDFFFDCHGDRVLMSRSEVLSNLEALAAKVVQIDPDLLLLQEVDVESKRSDYVDQVQWLLDHTDLNWGAYASQWKADFVPSDGIGRVDSGNAVLSRWPIAEATRYALPLIDENDALTNYFYLKRNVLELRVEVPGVDDLRVFDVHAEAFAKDGTKKKHIDRFLAHLERARAEGALVVGGGDLNALPPGSAKTSDFPDSVCEGGTFDADDHSAETDWLDALYAAWSPAIPLADYQADNAPYFTFTSDADGFWNRKLDYLFTNGTWVPGSGLTHQDAGAGGMETMSRSDHAPLSAVLDLEAWP